MNFPDGLFTRSWTVGAYLPLVLIWLWCLRTVQWRRLSDTRLLHVWLGTIVVLTLLWSLKAETAPGLTMHLLGATAFTLMFGRQLAFAGLSIVLAAATLNGVHSGTIGWQSYGLNALLMIVIPVFVAWTILYAAERWLPANFFVYLFFAAFFGAACNVVLTGFAATMLMSLANIYPPDKLFGEVFLSYVLLAFAEAWLTGSLITVMVVYRPHWVSTFDDRRYLYKK